MDGMVGYDAGDPITAFGVTHTPPSFTSYLDKDALRGARIGVIRESIGSISRPDSEDFRKVDAHFQRALEQLLMNMAQAMADARVTALAYKAVEHQTTLIAEATTPPVPQQRPQRLAQHVSHPHAHRHRADGLHRRRHSRRARLPRPAVPGRRARPESGYAIRPCLFVYR